MIPLQTEKNVIERSEDITEKTVFKIAANAKAFQVLSSNLYSDKIMAVCREALVNSLDAHVVAGTQDTPISVHLPNAIESFFGVRDFGTGLSHESVQTLYTSYFESSKTKDNSQTGCFGLGSKASLSYSDSFQVTSYYDGMARTYGVVIGETGAPELSMQMEIETDEPNGLHIVVPVNRSDFGAFRVKLAQAVRFFPVPPTVVGNAQYQPLGGLDDKPVLEGSNWKLMQNGPCGAVVVMGHIAYPIGDLFNHSPARELLGQVSTNVHALRELSNTGLILFAPLGELDVAASRETLSFDPLTVKNCVELLKTVWAELPAALETAVASETCVWDACVKLKSVVAPLPYCIRDKFQSVGWQGGKTIESFNLYSSLSSQNIVWATLTRRTHGAQNIIYRENGAVPYDQNITFIEKDAKHVKPRVKEYLAGKNTNAICVAIPSSQITAFCDGIGLPVSRVVKLSTLPMPLRASRASVTAYSVSGKFKRLQFKATPNFKKSITNDYPFYKDEGNTVTSGIYITIDRERVEEVNGNRSLATGFFEDFFRHARNADIDLTELLAMPVYAVTPAVAAKLAVNTSWKTFAEYVYELTIKQITANGMLNKIQIMSDLSFSFDSARQQITLGRLLKTVAAEHPSSPFAKMQLLSDTESTLTDYVKSFVDWLVRLGLKKPLATQFAANPKAFEFIRERYPMVVAFIDDLEYLSTYPDKEKAVIRYIGQMDLLLTNPLQPLHSQIL